MHKLRQARTCRLLEEREKALHRVQHELENLREDHISAKVETLWILPLAMPEYTDLCSLQRASGMQKRPGLGLMFRNIDVVGMLQDEKVTLKHEQYSKGLQSLMVLTKV